MHELAVCQELLDQVRATARANGATAVGRITVRLGPLSGVEPDLLERAFDFARPGEYTRDASLVLERSDVRIRCRDCGIEAAAAANRLVCSECGGYHVDLVGGDELLLASIELHGVGAAGPEESNESEPGEATHV